LELDKEPEAEPTTEQEEPFSQGSSILDFCDSKEGSQDKPVVSRPFIEVVNESVQKSLEPKKVPQGPPKKKRHYYMNEDKHLAEWEEKEAEAEQKEFEKQQRKAQREEKKRMDERHREWKRFQKETGRNIRVTPQRSAGPPPQKKKKKTVAASAEEMITPTPIGKPSCIV
jgi:hypothetical protein